MSTEETYQYNLFKRDYERWKYKVDEKLNDIFEILGELDERFGVEDSQSDEGSQSHDDFDRDSEDEQNQPMGGGRTHRKKRSKSRKKKRTRKRGKSMRKRKRTRSRK